MSHQWFFLTRESWFCLKGNIFPAVRGGLTILISPRVGKPLPSIDQVKAYKNADWKRVYRYTLPAQFQPACATQPFPEPSYCSRIISQSFRYWQFWLANAEQFTTSKFSPEGRMLYINPKVWPFKWRASKKICSRNQEKSIDSLQKKICNLEKIKEILLGNNTNKSAMGKKFWEFCLKQIKCEEKLKRAQTCKNRKQYE